MYIKNRTDKKGHNIKLHGRGFRPATIGFATLTGVKKLQKLEADLQLEREKNAAKIQMEMMKGE